MSGVDFGGAARLALRGVAVPLLGATVAASPFVIALAIANGPDSYSLAGALGGHAAALFMIALQVGVGWRVIDRFAPSISTTPFGRASFAYAIGFQITTGALLLLAWGSLLSATSIAALAAACIVFALPVIRAGLRALRVATRDAVAQWKQATPAEIAAALGLTAFACFFAAPFLLETALPNSDWDSALYHLPLAERYLNGQLWNTDPVFSAYSFPGAVSLLYAALLGTGLEVAIAPLDFWIAIASVAATGSLGAAVGGRAVAGYAAALFAANAMVWQLAVDPRIDLFLVLFLVLAVQALVVWLTKDERVEWLYAVALCLGAALGCKYSALLYAGGIGGVALVAVFRERGAAGVVPAAWMAVLLFLPHASWYVANTWIHHNPVYAMFTGHYGVSPDGERRHLVTALASELERVSDDPVTRQLFRAMSATPNAVSDASLFDVIDVVRNPETYAPKPNHALSPLILLAVAWPWLVWHGRRSRDGPPLLVLFLLGGWIVVFWCAAATQIAIARYELPVAPLIAVVGALFLCSFTRRVWRVGWALLLATLLVQVSLDQREKLESLAPEAWLSGDLTRLEWLTRVGYNGETSMPELIAFVNGAIAAGEMKADANILMVGEGKGRLLDCDYLPDSSWSLERFSNELLDAGFDHALLAERLRERGVTHILYNRGYYDWVLVHTTTPRSLLALSIGHLRAFLREYGTSRYDTKVMRLVEL